MRVYHRCRPPFPIKSRGTAVSVGRRITYYSFTGEAVTMSPYQPPSCCTSHNEQVKPNDGTAQSWGEGTRTTATAVPSGTRSRSTASPSSSRAAGRDHWRPRRGDGVPQRMSPSTATEGDHSPLKGPSSFQGSSAVTTAASPLRSFLSSQHRCTDVEKNGAVTPNEKATAKREGRSEGGEFRRRKELSESVYLHPCQFQEGGCLTRQRSFSPSGSAESCPFRQHPSVSCLHRDRGCRASLQGFCPWHHGTPGSTHCRLLEALFLYPDQLAKAPFLSETEECSTSERSSLSQALLQNAVDTATALSVFVDFAVAAVELQPTSWRQEFLLGLSSDDVPRTRLFEQLMQVVTCEEEQHNGDSELLVARCVKLSTSSLPLLGVAESLLWSAVSSHRSACQGVVESATGATGEEDWLHGPVACSMLLIPGGCRSREGSGLVLLSPLLRGWLLEQVQRELCVKRSKAEENVLLSETTLLRERLQTAAFTLLRQRLDACEPDEEGGQSQTPEAALTFLRDAMIWSHLRVSEEALGDFESDIVVYVPPHNNWEEDTRNNTLSAGLQDVEGASEADPATAALSGGAVALSNATKEVMDLMADADGLAPQPPSLLSQFLFREVEEVAKDEQHRSNHTAAGLLERQTEWAWHRFHTLWLKVYHALLHATRKGAGPPSSSCTSSGPATAAGWGGHSAVRPARFAFLAQPALLHLCRQHALDLERRFDDRWREAMGWREWTDHQMFGKAQENLHTSLGYARHHQRWLGVSSFHSVLNGLFLQTLLCSEQHLELQQRSALTSHVLWAAPPPPSPSSTSTTTGPMTVRPTGITGAEHWSAVSQRDRHRIFSSYLFVLNGFLAALQDVGAVVRAMREARRNEFAARRDAFDAQQELERPSQSRRYNLKEWEHQRALKRLHQEMMGEPVFDRLLPHGTAAVSDDGAARLLRQLLEGGSPFQGLRLAAHAMHSMRMLRSAAKAPLPELVETERVVHKRVTSRRNPYKKQLVQVRVPTHRLVMGGAAESGNREVDPLQPTAAAGVPAIPLAYCLSEAVAEAMLCLSLRMGDRGLKLAQGILQDCVGGNLIDFVHPSPAAPRCLPFPTLEEVRSYVAHPSAVRQGVVRSTLLSLLGSTPSGAQLLFQTPTAPPEVLLGRRVPPTPQLLEAALLHTLNTPSTASGGKQQHEQRGESLGAVMAPQVFRVLQMDPQRFLGQAEVWLAVHLVQATHHFPQVLQEFYTRLVAWNASTDPSATAHILRELRSDIQQLERGRCTEMVEAVRAAYRHVSRNHGAPQHQKETADTTSLLNSTKRLLRSAAGETVHDERGGWQERKPMEGRASESSVPSGDERRRDDRAAAQPITQQYPLLLQYTTSKPSDLFHHGAALFLHLSPAVAKASQMHQMLCPMLWKWTLLMGQLREIPPATTPSQKTKTTIENREATNASPKHWVEECARLLLLSGLLVPSEHPERALPLTSACTPVLHGFVDFIQLHLHLYDHLCRLKEDDCSTSDTLKQLMRGWREDLVAHRHAAPFSSETPLWQLTFASFFTPPAASSSSSSITAEATRAPLSSTTPTPSSSSATQTKPEHAAAAAIAGPPPCTLTDSQQLAVYWLHALFLRPTATQLQWVQQHLPRLSPVRSHHASHTPSNARLAHQLFNTWMHHLDALHS